MDHIREQNLKPGDALPAEVRLGQTLRVSRGIVREAYRSLATVGVIEVANGKRPRVGRFNAQTITQVFSHALTTDQTSPQQVLEVRRLMEVGVAQLAAERRQPTDLTLIHASVLEMRRMRSDLERYADADAAFHTALARATQNPMFVVMIGALRGPLRQAVQIGMRSRTTEAQRQRVFELHDLIAGAVEAGDSVLAGELMTLHFTEAVNAIAEAGSAENGSAENGSGEAQAARP